MENDKGSQNPAQNQNDNRNLQTDNGKGYGQYIDPDYQNKRKRKTIILVTIIAIIVLGIITAVAVFALSSGSNDSDSTNEAVNVVENCEDEECFNEKFSLCQPASYEGQGFEENTTIEYKISGVQNVGCLVTLEYLSSADQRIIGKEMTCDLNNELEFRRTLEIADEYPDDFDCQGSLVDFYNQLEEEALMFYGI